MSKIGNIYLSYGKQFNIGVANTYSNIILSGSNLPTNSIIISSPVDDNYNDVGSYSVIAVDNEGNPVRLTYCIKQGNGLNIDNENKDVIYLNIDNNYIKNSSSGLYIDLSVFNHNAVYNNDNKLSVDIDIINSADVSKRGIVAIDGKTIKSDDNVLYINTDALTYSDNGSFSYGTIKSGDDTININRGIISLNQNNLPFASEETFGLSKGDEYTTSIINETLKVNTENLDKVTESEYGIMKGDNSKIISDGGTLSVNTLNLSKASNEIKGIVGIDNDTIQLNEDDQITIPNYNDMKDSLSYIKEKMINLEYSLDTLKNDILSQIK